MIGIWNALTHAERSQMFDAAGTASAAVAMRYAGYDVPEHEVENRG